MAHIKAFALDPKNQEFLNKFYGEPKEMKCFLCGWKERAHGNNAQPFCREPRQELVCDDCNRFVLHIRQFCASTGVHPYEAACPQECLDATRVQAFALRCRNTDLCPTRPAEKSAPTRNQDQSKSQSKRAM